MIFQTSLMLSRFFHDGLAGSALAINGHRNQWGVSALCDITQGWFSISFLKSGASNRSEGRFSPVRRARDAFLWNTSRITLCNASARPSAFLKRLHRPVKPHLLSIAKNKRKVYINDLHFSHTDILSDRLLEPITSPELDSQRGHRRRLVAVATLPAWLWL